MIALAAVAVVARRPTETVSAVLVAACAGLDVALGAPLLSALGSVAPMLCFLIAALTLASAAGRSGLSERVAGALAALAAGRSGTLFALVCGVCALLTAVVSLDGAVVLMVPLLLELVAATARPSARCSWARSRSQTRSRSRCRRATRPTSC